MNSKCMNNATILHELYHVLGFEREHFRSDRDEYVTILYENIWSDADEALFCDSMIIFTKQQMPADNFCGAFVCVEKGFNILQMNSKCMNNATILHELYHVLGFEHEHFRSDRDEYVTILYENIWPGVFANFEMKQDDDIQKIPYDYESISHYHEKAFSMNGKLTIRTK
ncbi:Zinc metalloproteinase nas-5, partial [Armadillidium nasatum]